MNKVKLFITSILAVFFLSNCALNAQSPAWQWAKSVGGANRDAANCVTTDFAGNLLVAGHFESQSITFGSNILTSTDAAGDLFLAKYDAAGNVLWAKNVGGAIPQSITTDAGGNIIISGYFTSATITFGSMTFSNSGQWDLFIVKYDPSGNVLWAKSAGGGSHESALSVATDLSGNIIAVGYYQSPAITFGATTFTNNNPASNTIDMFVVKYDPEGNLIWAKGMGGNSYDALRGVTTDPEGNIIVAGDFSSSSITISAITINNTNNEGDAFIAKFDANGNVLWAKNPGGIIFESANSVSSDAYGNIYVAGDFYGVTMSFGSISVPNTGGNDMFLAKYDAAGNVVWAKGADGSADEHAYSVSTTPQGNTVVTGPYTSPSLTFGSTVLTNAGSTDIFLAQYNTDGNLLWAKSMGSNLFDQANDVYTDASGNVYLVGEFYSSSIVFDATTLSSQGKNDIFIAKIGATTATNDLNNEEVNVYPNPSSGLISYEIGEELPNAHIEIYDMLGRQQLSQKITALKGALDLSNFDSGVYVITIKSDYPSIWTRKLILQKQQ